MLTIIWLWYNNFLINWNFPGLADLSWLCPVRLTYQADLLAVPPRLSCLSCPVRTVMFWSSCRQLFRLGCFGCPVPAALSLVWCSYHPVLSVMSQLPCSCCSAVAACNFFKYFPSFASYYRDQPKYYSCQFPQQYRNLFVRFNLHL